MDPDMIFSMRGFASGMAAGEAVRNVAACFAVVMVTEHRPRK
jgi:hypothetical protein